MDNACKTKKELIEELTSLRRKVAELENLKKAHMRAIEALKISEEKYIELFENLNDAAFVADTESGIIIETNKKGELLLGRTQKEIIGMHQTEIHPPENSEKYSKRFATHIQKGHTVDYDGEVIRKDSSIVQVSISAASVIIGGRKLIIGLFRDITERKRMEEQLISTDHLASIGELAAGIAHELNNPLTSILGFSKLLLDKKINDDIREDIAIIEHEAVRAAEVVKNLLAFARKHKPLKQPVKINSIIASVLGLRNYEHKVNNIKTITHFASDLPDVEADSFQIKQVILDIIINAEYAMGTANKGGVLTITTEKKEDYVRITLTDDGIGISEKDLGHIFDPFFTTKEVGEGTGLGLSICHGIINKHGGRIFAQSEPGKGATFIIELPVKKGNEGGNVE